ncbi:MAG: hypothetical protein IPM79_10550 [Polyangiaceae bacterium]|jgi:hypothetical protein|nr:hypothetical protein [Polyangiaceae bacterium]MBK8938061.1 hypothetical protein [Polyangiaceae bacterium]
MQDELDAAGLDVVIFGVNGVGHESGNANVTLGRDLGWLQETAEEPVWTDWAITYRDVVILDENNEVVAIYNLTQHNLADSTNYAELYGLFEAAATP